MPTDILAAHADTNIDTAEVWYTVTQASARAAENSELVTIRVNFQVPGDPNPDPSTPYINKKLIIAQVQDQVDGPDAARGVFVTIPPWQHMKEGDRLIVFWGTQRLMQPPLPPEGVNNPQQVLIDKETLTKAGNGDQPVTYEIRSQVGNWSLLAQAKMVDVAVAPDLLAEPTVVQADEKGVLHPEALDGQDVQVRVYRYLPQDPGDTIKLTWAGLDSAGRLQPLIILQTTIVGSPIYTTFTIPNSEIVAIAGGYAMVSYQVIKTDGTILESRQVTVTVEGQTQSLAPPVVLEAVDNTLDPNAVPNSGATVEIAAYGFMQAGDTVELHGAGTTAGNESIPFFSEQTVTSSGVGQPLYFNLPAAQVRALEGGSLQLFYRVITFEGAAWDSPNLLLQVTGISSSLPAPSVDQANGDSLDPGDVPALPGAAVRIAAYPGMAYGDDVFMNWIGQVPGGDFSDHLPISASAVGKPVVFYVPKDRVTANLGNTVTVSYRVVRANGDTDNSATLTLQVRVASQQLPIPTIDEANGDHLDPANAPNGATVRIAVAAALKAGDVVDVRWKGMSPEATITVSRTITGADEGRALTVPIPASIVQASHDQIIVLDYVVTRASGGPAEVSPQANIAVGEILGDGTLLVMGARSERPGYGYLTKWGKHTRRLTALDADTLQQITASWLYEGETHPTVGKTFEDTDPTRRLTVRSDDDHVVLNPIRLAWTGYAAAMVLDNSSVVAWGNTSYGGTIPAPIASRTDIEQVISNDSSFTVLKADKSVDAWGYSAATGSTPDDVVKSLTGIKKVVPGGNAFCVLTAADTVTGWGTNGGTPGSASALTGMHQMAGSLYAFAAIQANGTVVTWSQLPPTLPLPGVTDATKILRECYPDFVVKRANGSITAWTGGMPDAIKAYTDIVSVTGNGGGAYVALRANGTILAWGNASYGGNPGNPIIYLNNIVKVVPVYAGFVALLATGAVVGWGNGAISTIPAPIAALRDIVELIPTRGRSSIAALRADGSVVGWGDTYYFGAGNPPNNIAILRDIVQVVSNGDSNGSAYAALRSNGQVVTWGYAPYGGTIPTATVPLLTNVRAIYPSINTFVAVTADKRVVTWGATNPSSAVSGQLNGHVSYESRAGRSAAKQHQIVTKHPATTKKHPVATKHPLMDTPEPV